MPSPGQSQRLALLLSQCCFHAKPYPFSSQNPCSVYIRRRPKEGHIPGEVSPHLGAAEAYPRLWTRWSKHWKKAASAQVLIRGRGEAKRFFSKKGGYQGVEEVQKRSGR